MNKNLYVFPVHWFYKGAKVVIYGAGQVGKQMYEQAVVGGYVEPVGIVDSKGQEASWNDIFLGKVSVSPVSELQSLHFDYVFVAVLNFVFVNEIRSVLVSLNIPMEKILWMSGFNCMTSLEMNYRHMKESIMEANSLKSVKDDGRETILFIDACVPRYDMNAGDRHTFQYLKLLAGMGFYTVFLPHDTLYHKEYVSQLQKCGVHVLAGFPWDMRFIHDWIKENGHYIDFAYLHRPDVSISYIHCLSEFSNAKMIYLPHDFHFLRLQREAAVMNDSRIESMALNYKKIEMDLIERSDSIHVFSSYEAGFLREHFPQKVVHQIPIYVYDDNELGCLKPISCEGRTTIMFVGGFGHTSNVDAVRWFCQEIYPRITGRIQGAVFYVVGSNPPPEILEMNGGNIITTGYVNDEKLDSLYEKARVMVAPLRYGAGVKGKVIEALMQGVPLVTTPIGAEGVDGLEQCTRIADTVQDFSDAVVELMQNDSAWFSQATAGREYLRQNFHISLAKKIMSQDFA